MNRRSLIKAMLAAPMAGLLSRLPGVDEPEITEAAGLTQDDVQQEADRAAREIGMDPDSVQGEAREIVDAEAKGFVITRIEISCEYDTVHSDYFPPFEVRTACRTDIQLEGRGFMVESTMVRPEDHLRVRNGEFKVGQVLEDIHDIPGVKVGTITYPSAEEDWDAWYRYEVAGYTKDEII